MHTFRILVVDDETDFLETIVNRLNKRKLDARGVTSGEAALDILKEELYDVVLLDIKMPGGMDGIETLREIKRIQPLVEVLLLTGHASVETSIEGMKIGAFDYLLKPMKFDDLLTKMAQAFEKKFAHDKKNPRRQNPGTDPLPQPGVRERIETGAGTCCPADRPMARVPSQIQACCRTSFHCGIGGCPTQESGQGTVDQPAPKWAGNRDRNGCFAERRGFAI